MSGASVASVPGRLGGVRTKSSNRAVDRARGRSSRRAGRRGDACVREAGAFTKLIEIPLARGVARAAVHHEAAKLLVAQIASGQWHEQLAELKDRMAAKLQKAYRARLEARERDTGELEELMRRKEAMRLARTTPGWRAAGSTSSSWPFWLSSTGKSGGRRA